MKLQIVVSSTETAEQVVTALAGLGHQAATRPDLAGLVLVTGLDPADAPTVHRIAALYDHPAQGELTA